jgi:hypothetical protein
MVVELERKQIEQSGKFQMKEYGGMIENKREFHP